MNTSNPKIEPVPADQTDHEELDTYAETESRLRSEFAERDLEQTLDEEIAEHEDLLELGGEGGAE